MHDIGYRGYNGPRLGRGAIARALFVHNLRGMYGLGRSGRSKVLPFGLFAVMCMPALIMAAIAVVLAQQGLMSQLPVPYSRYAVILQAVTAIFLAAQAPQVVSLDLRYKTIPLYLSRPLERVDYAVAKAGAVATGVFILLATPLVVLYVGALIAEFPVGEHTADFVLALLGAALFALVLSGVSVLIASLTPRRGFGIAAIVTVLALSTAVVSALQGIVGHAEGNMTAAGWIGLFSPFTLVDGVQVWAFGASSSAAAGPPGNGGGAVFALVTLAVIAGSFALLVRRYEKVAT
ncbi:ABC transporter permease [Actinobacteria bacterium YIM 96077]|uniref:ABC transporter permease n=1 Tax=Phytoactinopolyspora halophila TaxID=1981511 RepID=A0A329QPF8_9ACTN|nr:ABC transporter permease [Actinobacteria bacterium YIM 96077]RAW14133.1 ABC transporter permease [Phytoactinopolyspora halophila]